MAKDISFVSAAAMVIGAVIMESVCDQAKRLHVGVITGNKLLQAISNAICDSMQIWWAIDLDD
jgi:hypothetical protein